MIKVIVVDDERFVRMGIVGETDWARWDARLSVRRKMDWTHWSWSMKRIRT